LGLRPLDILTIQWNDNSEVHSPQWQYTQIYAMQYYAVVKLKS